MIYYRFKGKDDLWLGKYGTSQKTLIPNELLTQKQIDSIKKSCPRLSIEKAFEQVNLKPSDTYSSFGVKFQNGWDHNGMQESVKKGRKSSMKLRISEDDRSYKESKKRRTNGSNLKEATYKYRLVDGDTDEIIDTFVDEKSAEEYARQYIRNWATDDDPVYVDCYRIDDEDAQTEYPKYLEDDEYMWTLDSLSYPK